MTNNLLNNIIVIILFIGIILIIFNFGFNSKICSEQPVLYKYIPRDFSIDQNYPDNISTTFYDMFNKMDSYNIPLTNKNL
jgi:hypothetical protein